MGFYVCAGMIVGLYHSSRLFTEVRTMGLKQLFEIVSVHSSQVSYIEKARAIRAYMHT